MNVENNNNRVYTGSENARVGQCAARKIVAYKF